MAEDDRPTTEREREELEESAEEMGVRTDDRDPDEIVEEVRHAQADSETSPSEWRAKTEEEDD